MSTVTIIIVTAMIITVTMKDTTTPLKMANVLSVLEMVGGSADGGNGRFVLSPGSTVGGAEKLSEMNYMQAACMQGRDFYSVHCMQYIAIIIMRMILTKHHRFTIL